VHATLRHLLSTGHAVTLHALNARDPEQCRSLHAESNRADVSGPRPCELLSQQAIGGVRSALA
jgi:hypothetical protein